MLSLPEGSLRSVQGEGEVDDLDTWSQVEEMRRVRSQVSDLAFRPKSSVCCCDELRVIRSCLAGDLHHVVMIFGACVCSYEAMVGSSVGGTANYLAVYFLTNVIIVL